MSNDLWLELARELFEKLFTVCQCTWLADCEIHWCLTMNPNSSRGTQKALIETAGILSADKPKLKLSRAMCWCSHGIHQLS